MASNSESKLVPSKRASVRRAQILLVDDDALVRRAYRRLLSQHDVVEASGGEEALRCIRKFPFFNAILCDLSMPVMDGPAFFVALEQSFPMLVSRIVFVTGDSCDRYAADFLQRTQAKVLQKPVDHDSLRQTVQRLARGSGFFPPASGHDS